MPKPTRTVTVANVSQPLVQASLVGEAIDRGPVLVFVADEEMNYIAVNQLACDLLGYTREELLSRKVTDVAFDAEGAPNDSGRTILRRKDGTELAFEYSAAKTTVAGMALYVAVGFAES